MPKGRTRYIFSTGELKRKDDSITYKSPKFGMRHLPIKETHEIYLLNEVSLNTKFLDFIAKAGVTLHFFNYYGHYSGTFYPKEQLRSGRLTIAQAKAYEEGRLVIAKAIVEGIAANIHEVLYHYYRHDVKALKPFLDWLKKDAVAQIEKAGHIKQLLFVEGQIWMRFYESFVLFLPEDFLMNKRVKRPPNNPMNALVSFGNSLLYTKMISALYRTHLDQGISYLHEPSEGRFSLSLDLSEPFKPIIVFRTIFELVKKRRLQVEKHFDKRVNYCLLNEEGKKIFIERYEERLQEVFSHQKLKRKTTYQNALKLEGYKLIKTLTEGQPYTAFRLKDKQ